MTCTKIIARISACLLLAFSASGAALSQEIVIGQVAPLSGVLASTGKDMVIGAKAYFDSVNARGGIHGAKIRHVVKDDAYTVDETLRQTRELIENDKPVALIGFAGTGNIGELLKQKVLENAGIAMVGPYTGAPSLRAPNNRNIFHIRASYWDEAEAMIDQLVTLKMTRIGIMYQNGRGVPRDAAAAVSWFVKAAEQGVVEAQYNLGVTYGDGHGVPRDDAAALSWFGKAAEQGYAKAQNNLGMMYARGQGVRPDYVQAYKWFDLASSRYAESEKQSRENAVRNRDIAATKLTPAQIAEAQKLAREWKPKP